MGLVVSWVVGELDCLVGGLVLVERLVGWLVCQWVGWFFWTDCRCFGQSAGCLAGWIVGCSMVSSLVFC